MARKLTHITGSDLFPLPEPGDKLVLTVNGWPVPATVLQIAILSGILPILTVTCLGRTGITLSVLGDGRIDERLSL